MADNLTEAGAQQIIDTHPTFIKELNVFNDLSLTKKERIENAREILDYRKEIIREAMTPPSDVVKQRNKEAHELLRKLQGNEEDKIWILK